MDIIEQIRKEEVDCNNKDLFFSILLKGLIKSLNGELKIRDKNIPHFILGLGDEIMYLEKKGYDHSKEPISQTNEDYVYNIIPRCSIEPKGINLQPDQLSSPYCRGVFEYQTEDNIYSISANFRRIPLNMTVDLKYILDSFTDLLQLTQQIISKLSFIRTFKIVYMGQEIICSYSIPDSFDSDYQIDLSGDTMDNRSKILNLSLDVSTNYPVFDNKTVVSTDKIITNLNRYDNDEHNLKSAYHINVKNI